MGYFGGIYNAIAVFAKTEKCEVQQKWCFDHYCAGRKVDGPLRSKKSAKRRAGLDSNPGLHVLTLRRCQIKEQKNGSFSLIERVILSAGAMLIFSVSFQIDQMPEGEG